LSPLRPELIRDRLPAGTALRDTGRRDLRGMSRPEQVFELVTATGQADLPSTSATDTLTPTPDGGRTRRAAWIAVLPFENMSGDPEQDYFADRIAEDLITGLAASGTLRVIARTSSFHYRGSGATIEQIADELRSAMCWKAAFGGRESVCESLPSSTKQSTDIMFGLGPTMPTWPISSPFKIR